MTCDTYRAQLIAYLEAELAPDVRAALDTHLGGCGGCRAELQALQETLALVARMPAPEPSEAFWQQYLREIRQRAAAPSRTSAVREWLASCVRRPIPAMAAAVLVAVVVILTWRVLPLSERPALTELDSLNVTHQFLVSQDLDVLREMELLEEIELLEDWDLIRARIVPAPGRAA